LPPEAAPTGDRSLRHRLRRLRTPALIALLIVPLAVQARALVIGAAAGSPAAVLQQLANGAASPAPPKPVLVEVLDKGPDVDGDGAPDFVNPSGKAVRGTDVFGSGAFDASRDGGSRRHAGADYLAEAGQTIVAPISGYVTKIGYAYAGDDFRYVELTNKALGYVARVFYIRPEVAVGDAVHLGDRLGVAESLQPRYAGISDHVHLELYDARERTVNPTALIPTPQLRLALHDAGGQRRF
jgi:hypothetical protein